MFVMIALCVVAWFLFGLAASRMTIAYDKKHRVFNETKPEYVFYWFVVASGLAGLIIVSFFTLNDVIKEKKAQREGKNLVLRFQTLMTKVNKSTFGV